jgi:hypothetical protein
MPCEACGEDEGPSEAVWTRAQTEHIKTRTHSLTRTCARSSVTESPTGQAATPGGGSVASIFSSRAMRLASIFF